MSTMSPARRTVNRKPARRTARPSAPFGAGVFPRPTRSGPSDEDRAAAAAMFGVDADWDARMAADADGEECEVCGRPVESGELEGGLCNACRCRAEGAAMASLYFSAGMGWRSY
jgi:hypothetical protein